MPEALRDEARAAVESASALRFLSPRISHAAVVVLSALFIYLQVFVLPATPRLATGDQAIYLNQGVRMLHGELIYRDYDHFTLPGTDLLYMVLFRIFGVHAWIPQAMLVIVGASMVWLIAMISQQVLTGPTAFLAALLFVALSFSSYLDATHHWYSALAVAAALVVVIEQRTFARLVLTGALLAIATFFTQSMTLLVIGLAIFLWWEQRQDARPLSLLGRNLASLALGFIGALAVSLAYFVAKVGIGRIFYFAVIFVAKYYPADWFNNWQVYLTGRPHVHDYPSWLDVPSFGLMHLIIPWIYVLFFFWLGRKALAPELKKKMMLLNMTGLFLFLSVISAPAYTRLYVVSFPGLIVLIWALSRWKGGHSVFRLLWAMVLILALARPLFVQLHSKRFLDLPTGRTAFFDPLLYDKCQWMSERTRPGDYFFGDHQIAFVLRLRSVGRVPFLRPTDYTRPEEVRDAMQALEKFKVQLVSWYSGLDREEIAHRHAEGDHLDPMRLYLRQHYHLAHTFSNGDEMWERDLESAATVP